MDKPWFDNNEQIKKKKKAERLVMIIAFTIVVLAIVCLVLLPKEKIELEVEKLNYNNTDSSGCRTIKVQKEEGISEYSYDNGETWEKSNYKVICENKEVSVLGRNNNKKIIAEGNIKIKDLSENHPKISVDFENIINQFDSDNLLFGVNAFNKEQDLTEKLIVESILFKDDKLIVIYSITDDEGRKTTIETELEDEKLFFNIVSFEKRVYRCNVGEQIKTTIKAVSHKNPTVNVSKYETKDSSIATISKNPELALKTPSAVAVVIDCKKAGKTTLTAESSTGAKTTSELIVGEYISLTDKVSFEKPSYTCSVGDTINTTIKVTSQLNMGATISSYNSNNESIAQISKNPNYTLKTPSEVAVVISCNKVGKTTLTAKSNKGTTTTVPITVTEKTPTKETISFEKTKYTCNVGEQIKTVISATSESNPSVNISSYSSDNKTIATIAKNPQLTLKTPNAIAVVIDCKKAGTTTLKAKSSTGATTSVKVTVNKPASKETIAFAKTSYTCSVGEQIKTTIKATSTSNPTVSIASYSSVNQTIAAIAKDPYLVIRTPSELAVVIDCKKAGKTTLTAKSSTGATTSVPITITEAVSETETVSFAKTSYTCSVGETIETVISATSEIDLMVNIASYTSDNTNIATIIKNPNMVIRSPSELAVVIECKKAGTTTLTAISSTGASTKVNIRVN